MRTLPILLSSLLAGLQAFAPANAGPADPFAAGGRAWPAAPDPPRIQFVTTFSTPTDLGIRPGLWSRLARLATGAADERMRRPMAVAATPSGQLVVVTDPGAGCVHRFDLRRGRYDRLVRDRDTALPSPVGIAIATDGRVFVADSASNAVLVAGPEEERLRPVNLSPSPVQPTGVAVAANGDLFVASTGSHSVRRYAADGRLLREYGGRGNGPGQMNYPTYLWLAPPQELLVTDTLNFRIQRIDIENGVLGTFGQAGDTSGSLARPKGVAMDRHGHIYVMDGLLHALQVFERDGSLLLALGEQGREPGQFWLPGGIFVTQDGLIFVADSYNGRVQVFRYVGNGP